MNASSRRAAGTTPVWWVVTASVLTLVGIIAVIGTQMSLVNGWATKTPAPSDSDEISVMFVNDYERYSLDGLDCGVSPKDAAQDELILSRCLEGIVFALRTSHRELPQALAVDGRQVIDETGRRIADVSLGAELVYTPYGDGIGFDLVLSGVYGATVEYDSSSDPLWAG